LTPPCTRSSGARVPGAWNYGAVERALRDTSSCGQICIFEPVVGKLFDSTEEAFEFFNMYSWKIGFDVRFGRSRMNKVGRRTRQDIVCPDGDGAVQPNGSLNRPIKLILMGPF